MAERSLVRDRLIVAPWGKHGLVTVADPRYNNGDITSDPHNDATALKNDFPKFQPGGTNVLRLATPLAPRVIDSDRVGWAESNQGTDVRTIVVKTVNFFSQIMKTADHFPPQTHQELVLETKKHKRIWDGVVRRSNGLYVSGTNPQDLFDGMTTAGKIPYVTSLEGWSETYDESETPYDKGAKEIASIGVVQAGGWNWETPWNSSHNWKFNGVPKDRGLTDEGKEWYRALGANGVTLWDGSHESNGSIIDKVRLAKEKNQSHVRVLVSHAGVQMGRVVEKTRNPSKEAIEELLADGNSFFGIATSTSMLPGNNAEAVADAAEYLLDLDPTKGKQIGLGFDTNGKGGGTILEDVPTMLHLQKIAEAMYKRPRLRDLVEDIMWRNYASFLLNAMQAREHAA